MAYADRGPQAEVPRGPTGAPSFTEPTAPLSPSCQAFRPTRPPAVQPLRSLSPSMGSADASCGASQAIGWSWDCRRQWRRTASTRGSGPWWEDGRPGKMISAMTMTFSICLLVRPFGRGQSPGSTPKARLFGLGDFQSARTVYR